MTHGTSEQKPPALETFDITKDFGSGPVLSGISLTIERGETVAIMGPSGSGKTTLLHCLSGIMTPTTGTVVYDGREISGLGDKKRSRLRLKDFGFVFQDGQLLPELSAADNIALPARLNGMSAGQARKDAVEALDRLGIGHLADRLPSRMSGGQAQRVAIARALVTKPAIVFADEPTGALDQATGHEAIQLLTSVVESTGSTLVLVTHDAGVADWCGRRVEIRDGLIHDDRRK